ncbi:MAG: LuxR C-terminal-related transcriptional regulator [Actinomycetia bacterium]|nr:LuxR C-terminal-related transcriptional regulator [Actinomycetes bacterium]
MRDQAAPLLAATSATCQALLAEGRGRGAEGAEAWAAAADAWQELPRPYTAAQARERQAHCLRAAGHRDAARAELRATADAFTDLGAWHDADRLRRTLTAGDVGPATTRRAGRPGYGDRLSPRELEVVRLVTSGLTNREIATALSRSPKTVAAQLNSAMRKHGVSSRTALAVRITQAGYAPNTPHSDDTPNPPPTAPD